MARLSAGTGDGSVPGRKRVGQPCREQDRGQLPTVVLCSGPRKAHSPGVCRADGGKPRTPARQQPCLKPLGILSQPPAQRPCRAKPLEPLRVGSFVAQALTPGVSDLKQTAPPPAQSLSLLPDDMTAMTS